MYRYMYIYIYIHRERERERERRLEDGELYLSLVHPFFLSGGSGCEHCLDPGCWWTTGYEKDAAPA